MKVGYARTSTVEQQAGLDAQVAELQRLGCEKVFHEQVSSVAERAQLEAALDYIRDGDVLVVAKLDRLARSVPDPGFTHEVLKIDCYACFGNFESSSALSGAAISKPRRVIAERAQLPERPHA